MNNFKELAKLVKNRKAKINALYEDFLKNKSLEGELKEALQSLNLKEQKTLNLAILHRFVDLKEEALLEELRKNKLDEEQILALKYQIFDRVCAFYAKEHEALLEEIKEKKLLEPFYFTLISGVHKIGLVMNTFAKKWSQSILDKNNKALANEFKSLSEALTFLKEQGLYQKDRALEPCERSYGALVRLNGAYSFLPYALAFKDEVASLKSAFDDLIKELKNLAFKDEERAYILYLEKLKFAFCEEDNDKVIAAWQEAELAWLEVKSPLQIGHPLEYYEDNYTHAVALEWDIRLNDESEFEAEKFNTEIKESFEAIYKDIGANDETLKAEVLNNLNKTQLYICLPMLYYGANMNGLFSAQVVPNDEYVSNLGGKKIFAFLNFVYESTKSKPFMKLASEVFEAEFLSYGREILFFNERLWKQVYEVSTIGHEFGHIFFIAKDSEKAMNKSGVFKNIEEFKATAGGLMNFFLHEKEELRLPVFHELIKRAVGLIAWQRVEEVKPYYTEGLIHLSLLFETRVLSFENKRLKIDFNLQSYEAFKSLFIATYKDLARHYVARNDAKEFLSKFCIFENELFLPRAKECKDFVLYYYELYEKLGNELDENKEFQKYLA